MYYLRVYVLIRYYICDPPLFINEYDLLLFDLNLKERVHFLIRKNHVHL